MASLKKHVNQMTNEEKTYLLERLNQVSNWSMSTHLRHRMEQRGGSDNKVLEIIKNGDLIEYHQKDGVSRVLIRGRKVYYGSVLCAVFQFKENKVITLYWNNNEDNHSTLKEEAYDSKLDILKLIGEEE